MSIELRDNENYYRIVNIYDPSFFYVLLIPLKFNFI